MVSSDCKLIREWCWGGREGDDMSSPIENDGEHRLSIQPAAPPLHTMMVLHVTHVGSVSIPYHYSA